MLALWIRFISLLLSLLLFDLLDTTCSLDILLPCFLDLLKLVLFIIDESVRQVVERSLEDDRLAAHSCVNVENCGVTFFGGVVVVVCVVGMSVCRFSCLNYIEIVRLLLVGFEV